MTRTAAFLRSAQIDTGLDRWGSRDFVPRLARWLEAIARDNGLTEAGRLQAEAMTLGHARNRLLLEQLVRLHPEIERVELEPPVIVTGLPRSGTTALARKLSGGGLRWLPRWEAPRPFDGSEAAGRAEARRRHDRLAILAPALERAHDTREDAFVDDTELQCLAFGSYTLEWHVHAPSWQAFYLEDDQAPVYRYLKRALQALTFLRGGSRRWLLKSPQHLEQLPAIARVFPGARIIVSRRPHGAVLRSMDRVMEAMADAFRGKPFPRSYWPDRMERMVARFEATRALFPALVEVETAEWGAMPAPRLAEMVQ